MVFPFLKPILEAFDIGLQFSAELLQRPDLLVRFSEMLTEDAEDLLFRLYTAGVKKIEVYNVPYFFQTESKLL